MFPFWWGFSFWLTVSAFSPCVHWAKAAREFHVVCFIRTWIPFMKASSSSPKHLPRAHLLIVPHRDLDFNIWFGGTNHSEHSSYIHPHVSLLRKKQMYFLYSCLKIWTFKTKEIKESAFCLKYVVKFRNTPWFQFSINVQITFSKELLVLGGECIWEIAEK